MITIGGHYSRDASANRQAKTLHDKCIKLLQRREQDPVAEPDRLCDYQAMFLVEFTSQYRARRAAKVLSSRFAKMYHKTADDFNRTTLLLNDLIPSSCRSNTTTVSAWQQWIELAAWQRLLVACYILESQQVLLLAREPIPSLIGFSGQDLPFPCHQSVWDADTPGTWASAYQHQPTHLLYVFQVSSQANHMHFDDFQSSILINTYHNRAEAPVPYASALPSFDFESRLNQSPTTIRQLLATKLAHMTPLRALLAVSGESWIFSEKVPSPQAFTVLKNMLRAWVNQLWGDRSSKSPPPVSVALFLSVKILELALEEQKDAATFDAGPDMGIYFAGLVLWAITTAAHTKVHGSQPQAQSQPLKRESATSEPVALSKLLTQANLATPSMILALRQPPICSPSSPTPAPDAGCADHLMSHTWITINTIQFLTSVLNDYDSASSAGRLPSCLARCQTGCISLLLWVKLRLRGVTLGDDPPRTEPWTGKPSDCLGELLEGITRAIERMLSRGWTGWGI
ncbi:hypothetical protein ACN47E_007435 [Coniothyrium glycines]